MHDSPSMARTLPNSVATDNQNPIKTVVHASQTVKPLHVVGGTGSSGRPSLASCHARWQHQVTMLKCWHRTLSILQPAP